MKVTSLHVYPVKAAGGITLDRADVLAGGLRHDRRFMVLDEQGVFVTQREHPQMALVSVALKGASLELSIRGTNVTCSIPIDPLGGPMRRARVWDDEVDVVEVADGAAFFSEHLKTRCTLVYMPSDVVRPVEEPYGRPGDRVGLADGYPILIASLASLADLNSRLEEPVTMTRFRPNIVIDGELAYAEDEAAALSIHPTDGRPPLTIRTPKPCSRCQVVTIDQVTASRSKEPLKTLASYRTTNNQVMFAMNGIPDVGPGGVVSIAVGDRVTLTA